MKKIHFVLMVICIFMTTIVRAECAHLPKAIEHTRLSLSQGEAMKPDGTPLMLVSNLSNALEHARASEKAEKNTHTSEAILHLEAAVASAKAGEGKQCHMHTQEALKQLELAGQCPSK